MTEYEAIDDIPRLLEDLHKKLAAIKDLMSTGEGTSANWNAFHHTVHILRLYADIGTVCGFTDQN